jgi:glutamate--cysteine ligase
LELDLGGRPHALHEWAAQLLEEMQGICELLDAGDPDRPYGTALAVQQAKVLDPDRTPSARLLRELETENEAFFYFAQRMSRVHRDYFRDLYPPNEAQLEVFAQEAAESLVAQREVERADRVSFEEFVAAWFAA